MLKVTNVHKSFGKNEILKGVDLTVDKGDVVVILGPSANHALDGFHRYAKGLQLGNISVPTAMGR